MVLKITVKLTILCESHSKSHKSQSIIFVTITHQKAQVFVTLSQVWQQCIPSSSYWAVFSCTFMVCKISHFIFQQAGWDRCEQSTSSLANRSRWIARSFRERNFFRWRRRRCWNLLQKPAKRAPKSRKPANLAQEQRNTTQWGCNEAKRAVTIWSWVWKRLESYGEFTLDEGGTRWRGGCCCFYSGAIHEVSAIYNLQFS